MILHINLGPGVNQSVSIRLLTRLDWTADTLGETELQCRPHIPEGSGLEMIENPEASVRFNVVEEEEAEISNEEIVLTDALQYDATADDDDDDDDDEATRPEALPDRLSHDSERSESQAPFSLEPRTLTAGFSSANYRRTSGVTVMVSVMASVFYFVGLQ